VQKIIGAHSIIYSRRAEADRAFFQDVVGFPSIDVGEGWLIFALPPSELAMHPADNGDRHELYLMVADVQAFVETMAKSNVLCTAPRDMGWGVLTQLTLPGGGKLGVYEPRHARPRWGDRSKRPRRSAAKAQARKAKSAGKARRRTSG